MIRSSKSEMKSSKSTNSPVESVGNIPLVEPTASSDFGSPINSYINEPTPKVPVAVIGAKIQFKGELVGEEDLLIQGQVEGKIDLKGNHLIIGQQGVVKANVLANTIVIEGRVEGDVFGEDLVSIKSTSNVKGNIVANRVTLDDGAKFKGSIDMETDTRTGDFQKANGSFKVSTPASTPERISSNAESIISLMDE